MKDLRFRACSAVLALIAASGPAIPRCHAQAGDPEVPVTIIGQQQFEDSASPASLLELLRRASPQFPGAGNSGSENAQAATGTNFGGASVALHNLPTLVLIDGRRVADDPAEAEGARAFVDLDMIPPAAVERIEVLADGASAAYGSGAVGGVVNIILRKDFSGFDVGARYAFSSNEGHYAERQAWLTAGASGGATSVLAVVEFTRQDPVLEKDRPFTDPIYGTHSFPGHVDVFSGAEGFTDQFYQLAKGVNAPPGGGRFTIDQLVAMGIYVPVPSPLDGQTFNLADAETLSQGLARASALVNLRRRISGDALEAFGSVLFSSVRTRSSLNAVPIEPYISDPYTDLIGAGTTPPPPGTLYLLSTVGTNPFSPAFLDGSQDFASGALVLARNRFVDFPRTFSDDNRLLRFVGGLRGRAGDSFHWEVGASVIRHSLGYRNAGLLDTANLVAALNDGDVNPFAVRQSPGVLPGAVVGSAFASAVSSLRLVDAKASGDLADLPGGKLGLSAGAEARFESLSAGVDANSLPDPLTGAPVGWTGAAPLQPFSADRTVTSCHAEVTAPLVGPAQGIPGVHALQIGVAGRFDDDAEAGTSTVPKVSLGYEPIGAALTLRFSAGRAFVEPGLFELHGPSAVGSTFPLTFADFGGGTTTAEQFNSVAESNSQLKPSTASTWTAGFSWSPGGLGGLSVSAGYFQTVQHQLVGGSNQAEVVQGVELAGPASPYAPLVHLQSPGGPGVTAPGQLSTAVAAEVYIDTPLANLGAESVKGIDGTAAYSWNSKGAGSFVITSTATVLASFALQQPPAAGYFQYAGHATSTEGTLPRLRVRTTLDWSRDGASAAIAHTYVAPVTDIGQGGAGASPPTGVPGFSEFDVNGSLRLGELRLGPRLGALTVRAGIDNVFNRPPPLAPNAFPDTRADLGTYGGAVGREYYVSLDTSF